MVQKVSIILCSLSARERLWCAHRTPWIFLPVPLKILGSWVIHLPAHTMKSAYVHVDLNKRQRNTVMYNLTLCLRLFDIVLMRQNCRLSLGFDTQVCMLSLHDQCRIIIFLFLPHFLSFTCLLIHLLCSTSCLSFCSFLFYIIIGLCLTLIV